MRVLIAGGSGLLGKELIRELINKKCEVWLLSRTSRPELTDGLHAAVWNGMSAEGWGYLINQVDAVINLAGENIGAEPWTEQRKAKIISSRAAAGSAIVSAIQQAEHRPAVVIQASGIGAYGPSDDQILDETSPYGKDFPAAVTIAWEASTRPVEALGVRQVIIRTGLVMTRSGGWMQPLLLPFRFFVGGSLGSGKQWWPWIHIQDYVQSVIHLLNLPDASGVYNVVGPHPSRMEEFGKVLANVLRRPYWLPVPAFGLKLVLGEMSTLVLDGQRAVPVRLLESGYSYAYPDLRPALENLFR